MFIVNFETLGTKPNAAVIAIAAVDIKTNDAGDLLVEETIKGALNMKLDITEQKKKYNRGAEKGALDYWSSKQDSPLIKPSSKDLSLADAIEKMRDYFMKNDPNRRKIVWSRGSMMDVQLQSLCEAVNVDKEKIYRFYNWRDIRTGLECLKGTTKPKIGDEEMKKNYDKLNDDVPVFKAIKDAILLIYGNTEE